jgi:hypothetical protein
MTTVLSLRLAHPAPGREAVMFPDGITIFLTKKRTCNGFFIASLNKRIVTFNSRIMVLHIKPYFDTISGYFPTLFNKLQSTGLSEPASGIIVASVS